MGSSAGLGESEQVTLLTPLERALVSPEKQRLFDRHTSLELQQVLSWAVGLQGQSSGATTPPGYQQVGMVMA